MQKFTSSNAKGKTKLRCTTTKSEKGHVIMDCVPDEDLQVRSSQAQPSRAQPSRAQPSRTKSQVQSRTQSRSQKHNSHAKKCENGGKDNEFDVIIVGAGTAGSVAAKYISDEFKLSVLVLEAGSNQNENPFTKFPFGDSDPGDIYGFGSRHGINLIQPSINPKTTDSVNGADIKGFYDVAVLARSVAHGGRNWGGASAHHFLSAYHTSEQFDQLIADNYGNSKWSGLKMRAIKVEIETYTPFDSGVPVGDGGRGTSGPLNILKFADHSTSYIEDIIDALVHPSVNGIDTNFSAPKKSDMNIIGDESVSGATTVRIKTLNNFLKLGPSGPERTHAGEAFLGPSTVDQLTGLGKGGRKLTLISNAVVNNIQINKGQMKANGVNVLVDGKMLFFAARKRIILCAGALRNPGILERSGVGNASILTSLGVDMIYDNPNVGENYMAQLGHFSVVNINPNLAVPTGNGSEAAHLSYPGTLTNVGVVTESPYGLNRYSTHRTIGGPVRAFDPYFPQNAWVEESGADLDSISTITTLSYNMQPTSRGSCHIIDQSLASQPELIRNFMTTDEDIRFASETQRFAKNLEARLQTTNPGLQYTVVMPPPSVDFNNDNELDPYIKTLLFMTDHHMGTCAMKKTQAAGGVVGPDLHVFGIQNLMIADSSIYPIPPDCSTSFHAMVVGRQVSKFVLSELGF